MIKNDIEIDLVSSWNLCDGKMFHFVSFPLFGFTLVIKLGLHRKHRNTLKISNEKNMVSDLNMSHGMVSDLNMSHLSITHGKMSHFVLFPLFDFTLVVKLRNCDFKSHWNTLIFFDKKKILCQTWICPMEKCLTLIHFHCFGSS